MIREGVIWRESRLMPRKGVSELRKLSLGLYAVLKGGDQMWADWVDRATREHSPDRE